MIQDTRVYEEYYTVEDYQNFNTYLDGQIEKIDIENRDDKFLRTCLLTQYAYPRKRITLLRHLKAADLNHF